MKLQKLLFQSFSMLFVMIAAYVMPSCSSSDDIGGSNSEIVEKLKQSKWICRDVSSGVGSNDHAWVDFETNTLILHLIMLASLIGCKGTMTRISETPVIMTMMASLILLMEKG